MCHRPVCRAAWFTLLAACILPVWLAAADRDNWPTDVPTASGSAAYPNGPEKKPVTSWPPKGTPQRVELTEDDWFSAVGEEAIGNCGQCTGLKLKGQQEYFIFKAATGALKGKVVTGALLHTKTKSPETPFRRVGISTVAAMWKEGSSKEEYQAVESAPCYRQAEYKKRDWAYPGSTVMDVVLGRGHTIWAFADCSGPDQDGWQAVAVEPRVVRANIAGISHGFFAYDEVGSEWSDTGGTFTWNVYPNRFCYSLQQNKQEAPWLEVWVAGEDTEAPAAVKYSRLTADPLPGGEALLEFIVPADNAGGAGVIGFQVDYFDKPGNRQELPQYLIPTAGPAGTAVRMHLHDLPFTPGQKISVVIRAVDGAGNVAEPFTREIVLSNRPRVLDIAPATLKPFAPSENVPTVGGVRFAVVDVLDKINPVTGAMTPAQPKGYLGGNHLFSAEKKLIRLQAGRNETVNFQVVFNGNKGDFELALAFEGQEALPVSFHEFGYVQTGQAMLPDPLMPSDGKISIPSKAGREAVRDQVWHAAVAEIYVPHAVAPGLKKGVLTVKSGAETLSLNVELTVWNFTLPNTLSFIPEMNAYKGTMSPLQWWRLAHEHRCTINQVWYSWSGSHGLPLTWTGNEFDFTRFDKEVGPLLDGSAFAGLPRDREPLPRLYLPFNETWPVDLLEHFKPSFWVEEALDEAYAAEMKRAFVAFAKHADEKQWHHTFFEFFLNNKVYYRADGNNTKRVVAPWIFDEPTCIQDFWAIRWYGLIFHQAVDAVRGKVKMIYRADISYSHFGRNINWGVLDWECLGGANPQKVRMKQDEAVLWDRRYFSEYGSANKVQDANVQPVAWSLNAWANGADAILPWQTFGDDKSWHEADQTCLFYPDQNGAVARPSVRLKAFLRGEQDVEYLALLSACHGAPRYAVAAGLRQAIDLSSKVHKTSETDAGTIQFQGASPTALWELRTRVAAMVDAKKPAYQKTLRDWSAPASDLTRLPEIGYVPTAPTVESYKPAGDSFTRR